MDKNQPSRYRPISNLNNISKIIECIYLARILPHVTTSSNFNPYQFVYRRNHSTETVLLFTFDSCFTAIDNGKSTILLSLDLSAAFDTIDHITLINRLQNSFCITGAAFDWISSYLADRRLFVRINQARSTIRKTSAGVPQWSVLGQILFSLYISPVAAIARSHGIRQQQYADNTKLFIEVSTSDCEAGLLRLEEYIKNLHYWFCINGFALNPDKTDAVVFGTHRRSKSHTAIDSINVAGVAIQPSNQVNLLDVVLDEKLVLTAHVDALWSDLFSH